MTNDKQTELHTTHPVITQEALAQLGDGRLAYVKTIRSEDVASLFPQAPKIAPGIKLFSLHAADGTPIMLTDTREAALVKRVEPRARAGQRALTAYYENSRDNTRRWRDGHAASRGSSHRCSSVGLQYPARCSPKADIHSGP